MLTFVMHLTNALLHFWPITLKWVVFACLRLWWYQCFYGMSKRLAVITQVVKLMVYLFWFLFCVFFVVTFRGSQLDIRLGLILKVSLPCRYTVSHGYVKISIIFPSESSTKINELILQCSHAIICIFWCLFSVMLTSNPTPNRPSPTLVVTQPTSN